MNMIIYTLSFILTLGILITVHEWGHFIVAKKLGVKVLRFSIGFGKPIWQRTAKDGTQYCIACIPLGGYVKMLDEREGVVPENELAFAFNRKSVWTRIAIVLAGPLANFIFAVFAFTTVYTIGVRDFSYTLTEPALIGEVETDSPAQIAGLQTDDKVIAVNQQAVKNWFDFVDQIALYPSQTIDLTVVRQQEQLSVLITPASKIRQGKDVGYIGVAINDSLLKNTQLPIYKALGKGVADTWFYSFLTFESIIKMLMGQLGLENLSGPISIAVYAGHSVQSGLVYFLQFLALLSISLGVINLLPIPMLDGGHLLYYVVEVLRRKPLSLKVQQMGLAIGLVLLVSLMVLAFYNDVIQLSR